MVGSAERDRSSLWLLFQWLQDTCSYPITYTEATKETFTDTGITVSTEGEYYLCRALGTTSFVQQYIERELDGWVKEIEKLSNFAATQPRATCAAFTHGLSSKWKYLLRVTDWQSLLASLLIFSNHLRQQFGHISFQHSRRSLP